MKRANPEARLQTAVKEYLGWCLPPSIFWTASLTGTHLTMQAAARAKAMGVRRGLPDLVFVFPDGVSRWIELKTPTGSLSPEQRVFRDLCRDSGRDIWALARTVEEVAETLTRWGAPMKAHPFGMFSVGEAA